MTLMISAIKGQSICYTSCLSILGFRPPAGGDLCVSFRYCLSAANFTLTLTLSRERERG